MIRSRGLNKAEAMLFEIMYREHQEATKAADALLKARTAALYDAFGIEPSLEGHFQVDPMDRSRVSFLYDDGVVEEPA